MMRSRPVTFGFIACALLIVGAWANTARANLFLIEDLGNFPDAIAVGGEVGTISTTINSDIITNVMGILFTLENTSFGDGVVSSFVNDPDGDFAENDVLTQAARDAIAANQPFGIFKFIVHLPDSFNDPALLAGVSAPSQFLPIQVEPSDDPGFFELIFEIAAFFPDRVLFDSDVPPGDINPMFTNPETGLLSFFIPSTADFDFSTLQQIRNSPGLNIRTQMAWFEAYDTSSGVVTDFILNEQSLRLGAHGEVQVQRIPEPSTLAIFAFGLAGLGFVGWRRRRTA